ncbi:DUF427 domain-containing protein [Nocardia rhamnosiphila]|uniref:DUF427 domain-containing protein n=1 Tax=Nocardia rhamnosiphila TaxID=426716 RepID=UPI0004C2D2BD|nr:DUF427 domain-containing protein [Nocardia rhamnosiphila]
MSEVPSGYRQRPDYRVDLLARTNTFTATVGARQLASSDACLLVDEQDHGLVVYFPPEAVDTTRLEPIDLHTLCPYKGEASYWALPGSDRPWIAWTYPQPHLPVARLAGYIAFDQNAVAVTIGAGRYTGVRS